MASFTSSMDQVGTSHMASTDAAAAVSLYNGGSYVCHVGTIQEEFCSSTKSLQCGSYTDIVSSFSMAIHLPCQIGSMYVGSILSGMPHFHGSKTSSLESSSMKTLGVL